jgi:Xaa-Pro aminopeptidase
MVLILPKGKALYIVDNMNASLAEDRLEGINVDIMRGAPLRVLSKAINDLRIKKLGIDTRNLTANVYIHLINKCKKTRMKDLAGILRTLREMKDSSEVTVLRKAARETVRIWDLLKKKIRPGISEKELCVLLDGIIVENGYTNSFPSIVAFGKNSAYPHAIPTNRKLAKNEHVLVDFGIVNNGYCSDLTRTWAKGRINRKIRELVKYVDLAQEEAIKKIKPGIRISSLAEYVNNIFTNNGLGEYIRHGLGHGVGMNVHESPFVGKISEGKLRSGMVITIEPGLYIAGVGGIRKEDMVLITNKGCEVLTR